MSIPEHIAEVSDPFHGSRLDRVMTFVVSIILTVLLLVTISSVLLSTYETHTIRTTQINNTAVSQCQQRYFKAILIDVKLAFAGDKNPADYAKAPKC